MAIVIKMDNAVRFASLLENVCYEGSSDTNREHDRMTLIIYK
jgi:hypothetical protein